MSSTNSKPSVDDILKKYGSKIEGQINTSGGSGGDSKEYQKFKLEMSPEYTGYEKLCHSLGNFIKLKPAKKDEERIQKAIDIAHLQITAQQAITLSVMSFMVVFILSLIISIAMCFIAGKIVMSALTFFILMLFVGLFLFYFANQYPLRMANKWRLKASTQMVPAILYIVVYMRHTANLEKAIAFAAEHLQYPLALDLRKVFYNVEIGKFSSIKESLDNYLEVWREYSPEFIEAFHLIESSLYEPDSGRRIIILEKSLQVVLDGVYDKMLKFTHDVKGPLTNVYMLGVVLPTLGLALIPLASSMVGDFLKWNIVFVLFNLVVPFMVFFLTDKIMFLRPGGHGESEFLEKNPLYAKYKSNVYYGKAFLMCLPFLIIGFLPLIMQITPVYSALGWTSGDPALKEFGITGNYGEMKLFGFIEVPVAGGGKTLVGPFGVIAVIMSMFIPLGLALFFSMSFKGKTKELILERQKTKELEAEFNNSLFQLGNRLGNGTPPELVFSKVAESSKGLRTEDFFRKVNYNIQQGGMSVDKAIFDTKRGALIYYPSELIATSMRILVEASKKGLNVAAVSLMSISQYVKNIQKITDRLKDLLAEIISDMKSNMTFLAPFLAGIVVGLTVMISAILSQIPDLGELAASGAGGMGSSLGSLGTIFKLVNMMPPYHLQIIVGIYLIEIVFILTSTLVIVDAGEDKLEKTNKTGKNLSSSIGLYFVVALLATIILSLLVQVVLGGTMPASPA